MAVSPSWLARGYGGNKIFTRLWGIGFEFGFVHGLKAMDVLPDAGQDVGERYLAGVVKRGCFPVFGFVQGAGRQVFDQKRFVAGYVQVVVCPKTLLFARL